MPSREQRWRERQERWVAPADRPLFDPEGFEVRPVAEGPAREFVEAHHYSGSYVASRVRSGVFDPHGELVGVAVFSVGMNPRTLPSYFGPGVPGVELGRFVLLDELGYNAETWVLRRAFAQLRRELPDVQAVLAFSDPVPRQTWLGDVVTPGHVGTIYKAFGGRLLGRSEPRTRYLDILGREVSLRGLGKVRGPRSEREFAREVERLVAAGAPAPRRGEEPVEWVRRALASGAFQPIRHPGNLAYAWSVAGRDWTLPERRYRDLGGQGAHRGRALGRANLGEIVGWRVARYVRHGRKEEAVSGADSRLRWPLRVGAVHTAPRAGLFVSPSREYVLDHYAVHDDNVLLKYRFRGADIRQGSLEDREPELGIARATLIGWWPFTDEPPVVSSWGEGR